MSLTPARAAKRFADGLCRYCPQPRGKGISCERHRKERTQRSLERRDALALEPHP